MFSNPNPWNLKSTLKMPTHCPECGQLFELEVGFWYGTAYISYLVTVTFLCTQFCIMVSNHRIFFNDNRFFWWLGINGVLIDCSSTLVHAP